MSVVCRKEEAVRLLEMGVLFGTYRVTVEDVSSKSLVKNRSVIVDCIELQSESLSLWIGAFVPVSPEGVIVCMEEESGDENPKESLEEISESMLTDILYRKWWNMPDNGNLIPEAQRQVRLFLLNAGVKPKISKTMRAFLGSTIHLMPNMTDPGINEIIRNELRKIK